MSESEKYQDLVEKHPMVGNVVPRKLWDHVNRVKDVTVRVLEPRWLENIAKNTKTLYPKHGAIGPALSMFGHNKAAICIGAGPSFNLNKNTLKEIMKATALFRLDEQPFILMCSNHQLKPCMADGIFPHFVVLVDSADTVFNQLCVDIPRSPKPILLTSLATSPKILTEWDRQGGAILFYLPMGEEAKKAFEAVSKDAAAVVQCEQGGNVMNESWILSVKFMKSKVFMAVGNDLAYPRSSDITSRRHTFYADGDYSTNLASKRDEANKQLDWMGFTFVRSNLDGRWMTGLKLFHTSTQLITYKVWLEGQVAIHAENKIHYYNCSEQGILGVMARDLDKKALPDPHNWYLLDETLPRAYHTRRLEDAARQFLEARECVVPLNFVKSAGRWAGRISTARDIGLSA